MNTTDMGLKLGSKQMELDGSEDYVYRQEDRQTTWEATSMGCGDSDSVEECEGEDTEVERGWRYKACRS